MAQNSAIEWTDATFNPWVGCTKVSPGCKFCYAESFMTKKPRWANTWGPTGTRLRTSESNWKQPLVWNKQLWSECQNGCGWRGDVQKAPVRDDGYFHCPECGGLTKPTRQRVFCASLADVFEDNDQLIDWRLDLFELILATPNLDWLLLTKRPENVNRMIADMYGDCYWLEDYGQNIWVGTSVENQEQADKRIPALLDIPAKVRFLSVEPLLGPVDLSGGAIGGVWIDQNYADVDPELQRIVDEDGWPISWVIVGGESGPNARPMHPQWARDLRDQCQAAGIPFFFKQHGEWIAKSEIAELTDDGWQVRPKWIPVIRNKPWGALDIHGNFFDSTTTWNGRQNDPRDDREVTIWQVGKKAAGNLLDVREWKEFPQ